MYLIFGKFDPETSLCSLVGVVRQQWVLGPHLIDVFDNNHGLANWLVAMEKHRDLLVNRVVLEKQRTFIGEIFFYKLIRNSLQFESPYHSPPFEKPDHLKISGKPPQTRQSRRTVPPPSTVGSSLLLSIVFALVVTTYSPKGFSWFFSVRVRVACYFRFISPLDEAEIWGPFPSLVENRASKAIGFSTTNPNIRVDTLFHQLHYPQRPLFRTMISDCLSKPGYLFGHNAVLPKPDLFNGQNAIVAVNVHLGYNQADSLVMKRASLERGMFRSEHIRSYKAKVDNRELTDKRQKSEDSITFGKIQSKIGRVDSLNDDGFPFIGVNMQSGDIVIGKCAESGTDHTHYCLASDRRDCNYLPPFEKPDHLKISGKPPQTRQSRRTVPPPSTVGSSLFLSIVFALVVTTYSPKGFSWFFSVRESPAIFASYHRWMKLKFGYVVLLSMINVLNGGDEKLTVQQGDMYVEQ
uniref:DNA-directed RNA polymerase n=1 Tax=Salix viminalis TaxID=40686 RepID=A0A6N2N206_SALVM